MTCERIKKLSIHISRIYLDYSLLNFTDDFYIKGLKMFTLFLCGAPPFQSDTSGRRLELIERVAHGV